MASSEMYERILKAGSRKLRRQFSETAARRYEEIFYEAEMIGHLMHIQALRAASGFPGKPASDYEVWISPDLQEQYLEHWNAAKSLACGSPELQELFDSLQRMSGKPGDLPERTFSTDEMDSILVRVLESNCRRIAVLNRRKSEKSVRIGKNR